MIIIFVLYADVFWLNQFLLHTAILLLVQTLHGRFFQNARCILASASGSTLGTALIILVHSYYAYLTAECFAILPLMTVIAFGKSDFHIFLNRYVSCFGTAILLGGLVAALENISGITQIPFLSVLIAFLIAGKWIGSLVRHQQVHSLLTPIILRQRGTDTKLTGFIDTGNLLREPYCNRGVHLMQASRLEECNITKADFLGLVSYRTLGSSDGFLEIYRADALGILTDPNIVHTSNDIQQRKTPAKWLSPAIIAKAPCELFYGKEYDIILNSEIIIEGGSI